MYDYSKLDKNRFVFVGPVEMLIFSQAIETEKLISPVPCGHKGAWQWIALPLYDFQQSSNGLSMALCGKRNNTFRIRG